MKIRHNVGSRRTVPIEPRLSNAPQQFWSAIGTTHAKDTLERPQHEPAFSRRRSHGALEAEHVFGAGLHAHVGAMPLRENQHAGVGVHHRRSLAKLVSGSGRHLYPKRHYLGLFGKRRYEIFQHDKVTTFGSLCAFTERNADSPGVTRLGAM